MDAIYHFHIDLVRRHRGGNALERAAYQARQELTCPVTRERYDHSSGNDLVDQAIVGTSISRTELWTEAELSETRLKAVVCRSIKVALPLENGTKKNWALLRRYSGYISRRLNTPVDVAYHRKYVAGKLANHHGHFLVPTREWNEETKSFTRKTRELDHAKTGSKVIKELREVWEEQVNQSLPKGAKPVSCRSHADCNDGMIPLKHLGAIATEMERRGKLTRLGNYNETAKEFNDLETESRALEKQLAASEMNAVTSSQVLPCEASETALAVTDHAIETDSAAVKIAVPGAIIDANPESFVARTRDLDDDILEAEQMVAATMKARIPEAEAVPAVPPLPPVFVAPSLSRQNTPDDAWNVMGCHDERGSEAGSGSVISAPSNLADDLLEAERNSSRMAKDGPAKIAITPSPAELIPMAEEQFEARTAARSQRDSTEIETPVIQIRVDNSHLPEAALDIAHPLSAEDECIEAALNIRKAKSGPSQER